MKIAYWRLGKLNLFWKPLIIRRYFKLCVTDVNDIVCGAIIFIGQIDKNKKNRSLFVNVNTTMFSQFCSQALTRRWQSKRSREKLSSV